MGGTGQGSGGAPHGRTQQSFRPGGWIIEADSPRDTEASLEFVVWTWGFKLGDGGWGGEGAKLKEEREGGRDALHRSRPPDGRVRNGER